MAPRERQALRVNRAKRAAEVKAQTAADGSSLQTAHRAAAARAELVPMAARALTVVLDKVAGRSNCTPMFLGLAWLSIQAVEMAGKGATEAKEETVAKEGLEGSERTARLMHSAVTVDPPGTVVPLATVVPVVVAAASSCTS